MLPGITGKPLHNPPQRVGHDAAVAPLRERPPRAMQDRRSVESRLGAGQTCVIDGVGAVPTHRTYCARGGRLACCASHGPDREAWSSRVPPPGSHRSAHIKCTRFIFTMPVACIGPRRACWIHSSRTRQGGARRRTSPLDDEHGTAHPSARRVEQRAAGSVRRCRTRRAWLRHASCWHQHARRV